MQQFSDDFDDIPLSKFELMLKTNSVYFFDASEFEEIIMHYIDNGKFSLANKAIQLGLKQHPKSVDIKLVHVELLILEEKFENAEKLLNELQEIDVTNEEVYIQKATIYSKKGLHKKAIVYLQIALDYTDDVSEIYSLIGMEYLFLDEFDTARENFAKCLDVEYDNYSSLYNVIYCYDMAEQHTEAIAYLKSYIDKDPYSEVAWHQLGRQYYILEDFQKALEAFEYAILVDETFIGAHLEKAKTLEELNRFEEAISYYQMTMELDTPTPFAYLRIGKCYEKLGKASAALEYYTKTVNEDPLLDKGWLALTDIYLSQNKPEKALQNIKKAIGIDEDIPDYWNKMGEIYVKLNQLEAAAGSFQKSLSLQSDSIEVHLALADVLIISQDPKESLQVLKEAQLIFNDDAGILYRLAGTYYLLNKLNKSMSYLTEALALNFEGHVILEELFPALLKEKAVSDLLEQYRK